MDTKILRCLQNILNEDRAAYRRSRTRLAVAEGTLAMQLREWQDAGNPMDRAALRHMASAKVRDVRRARRAMSGVAATLRGSHGEYLEALAVARGNVRIAA